MNREILTKRIDCGWSSPCGRVRALRNTELLDAVKAGNCITTSRRKTFWDVHLLDANFDQILDEESVNILDEADDQAWQYMNHIHEGRA